MKYSILTMLFILNSCASSYKSLNETIQGEVDFKTGTYQDTTWSDSMIFQRTSWYRGLSMGYDLLLHRLDRQSPFAKWLEESEKEYLNNCHPLVIGIMYSSRNSPTTIAKLKKEITDQNYEEINLINFKEYIKNHPTYQLYNLWTHQISAFCGKHIIDGKNEIYVSIPNFKKIKVLE